MDTGRVYTRISLREHVQSVHSGPHYASYGRVEATAAAAAAASPQHTEQVPLQDLDDFGDLNEFSQPLDTALRLEQDATVAASPIEMGLPLLQHQLLSFAHVGEQFSKYLVLASYLLETKSTEEELKLFGVMMSKVWGIELRGQVDPVVGILVPSTVSKLRDKCRRILGSRVPTVTTVAVPDPEKLDEVAYVVPSKVIELWLSRRDVLEKLIVVNGGLLQHHLDARNPVREALAAGGDWEFSEVWHASEYFDSVQRTRDFWHPNLPSNPETRAFFLHLGVFMDGYTVGNRQSQWIVALNLLGAGRRLAGKHNLSQPVAIFKSEGQNLELGSVFGQLRTDLEELASGFDFQYEQGAICRGFVVVSHLMGDISALRTGLCLKIPASCKYPCVFCRAHNHHRPLPPGSRCPYSCGLLPQNFARKTSEEYDQAFRNAGDTANSEFEHMAVSTKRSNASFGFKFLRGLPGSSVPESVSIDLMHTEFLGETLRHLGLYFRGLVTKTRIPEAAFCSRISDAFRAMLQLNGIAARYEFPDLARLHTLLAFSLLKLVSWLPQVLFNAGISTAAMEADEQAAIVLRVKAIKLATQYALSVAQVRSLGSAYMQLATRCCQVYPEFCVLKSHLLSEHLEEVVIRLGPPRLYWCFRQEGLITPLKDHYLNLNNRAVSKSVVERWQLCHVLQSFCQSRSLGVESMPRSVASLYGNIFPGRLVTTASDGNCLLAEIVGIVSNEEASVRLHSHVLCFQEKFLAGLNTLGARTSLIRVDQLAPCVISQGTIPGAVEVVDIASAAHLALIRTFRPPS